MIEVRGADQLGDLSRRLKAAGGKGMQRELYAAIFPDFAANAAVGGATELSSSWNAAGPINRSF